MSQPNPPKKRKSSIKASVQPKSKVKIDAQAIAEAKAKDLAAHQHSQALAATDNANAQLPISTPYDYQHNQRSQPEPLPPITPVANSADTTPLTPVAVPVSAPEPTPVALLQPVWCEHTGQWQGLAEAVVGLSHRNAQPALPCQDAAVVQIQPRPVLVVCDGAGSAALSEYGSQALSTGLSRLAHTLELPLLSLLDTPHADDEQARQMVQMMLRHGKGLLQDLALQHRREVKDFRSTVLMVIVGTARLLWFKVGDGAIVLERIEQQYDKDDSVVCQPLLTALGEVGKGEFANQTTFVDDRLSMQDVQWGMHSSVGVSGLAAMSDGAAEKLVSNNGRMVSGQISRWLEGVREQTLRRRDLTQAFYSDRFNQQSTGDDRSIALLAAQMVWPKG